MPNVLIVDDEKNIRATLARGLRLEGYRTDEAENGALALKILDEGGIDLVLLDTAFVGQGEHDDMERVAGALDLGPLIAFQDVFGDERLLRQMILNLVSNGVKFTPPGGTVKVSLRVANGAVRIEVDKDLVKMPVHEIEKRLTGA